jgi:hypothetical protein
MKSSPDIDTNPNRMLRIACKFNAEAPGATRVPKAKTKDGVTKTVLMKLF